MKLTKVHRVLKFKQSDWLKKYIDFNADKRKHATKSFEKDFLSWWIIVFMENLRKWIKVKLVNNTKDYWKNVSRWSFISQKIFNKNLIAIHETKPVLTLDKPIYVRFSLLDLSNTLMYEFHYKCIKTKYSANLLFTDIQSIIYEIETNDVYEDFSRICLILVTIHKIQSFFILPVNALLVKWKMNSKGK